MRFLGPPSPRVAALSLAFQWLCNAEEVRTSCASDAFTSSKQSPHYYLNRSIDENLSCLPPLDPVTTITPDLYFANIPCLDCPVVLTGPKGETYESVTRNSLLYNISLSNDRSQLLLNDVPVFPALASPSKYLRLPPVFVSQISPGYAREDLDKAIACTDEALLDSSSPAHLHSMCQHPKFSILQVDYDYSAFELPGDNGRLKWKIGFDNIGRKVPDGPGYWTFNHTDQKMVEVILSGIEIEREISNSDVQAGSTLFGQAGQKKDVKYKLKVEKVDLVPRQYKFLPPPPSTLWTKIRHFFGFDPAPPKGHIVYLRDEWADYGKKNTLKNAFGVFIYDWPWATVLLVIGCIIASLLVLYGAYRLVLVAIEQRRLAQWGGMDEVWQRMRDVGNEEDGLLEDAYQDDPDDPPRYTDEVQVNKPLPSKPLPEKPLPAVPLIDHS
ncbi:hypothetical protein BU24DRAFT_491085 [Aaosphaeria arxii CBS 175.79]|uniref:Uncharacterized protein n=1 Tax=Aaosphaeria arxii CBS 175.79 TaxID=1450172 RepID=A0A6A5XYJ7_9PLEO|nr:uncharacterized protein BU24DRAFT_491085 [Aaosphaeria arxii CBS 175.79]KAF2018036.1 hypothetical protein BU24DRAFT_491085 [Aaosphaeria arxii CBS 175.79]